MVPNLPGSAAIAEHEGLELAQLISKLRDDLEEAMEDGEGRDIRFAAQAVELELKLGVTRVGQGKAGIKFWVLDASAGGKVDKESIQTVKLTLVPQTRDKKTGQYKHVMMSASTEGRHWERALRQARGREAGQVPLTKLLVFSRADAQRPPGSRAANREPGQAATFLLLAPVPCSPIEASPFAEPASPPTSSTLRQPAT